jgi:medium-chain acyl-[acyl-carrier-protein] hydrolase
MQQTIWTQDYAVDTMVLNPQKRLGLFGLLNILQDAAWNHAANLGAGFDDMIARGAIWVLTRQKLTMTGWPEWGGKITVRTWPCPFSGAIAPRQFEIFSGDKKLGECITLWLVMDAKTRRPIRINPADYPFDIRRDGLLAIAAGKIAPREGLKEAARFCVRNSDLDVNGHVNNTQYAKWILDSIPLDAHRRFRIASYEVNFLAETTLGDEIAIEGCKAAHKLFHFQGRRTADGKVVFTAKLGVGASG